MAATFHPKVQQKLAPKVESKSFMFCKKLFESYVPKNSFLDIFAKINFFVNIFLKSFP